MISARALVVVMIAGAREASALRRYSALRPQYTALYSEVTFRDRGDPDFSLSTAVCIVDATGAMVRPCLDNSGEAPIAE